MCWNPADHSSAVLPGQAWWQVPRPLNGQRAQCLWTSFSILKGLHFHFDEQPSEFIWSYLYYLGTHFITWCYPDDFRNPLHIFMMALVYLITRVCKYSCGPPYKGTFLVTLVQIRKWGQNRACAGGLCQRPGALVCWWPGSHSHGNQISARHISTC